MNYLGAIFLFLDGYKSNTCRSLVVQEPRVQVMQTKLERVSCAIHSSELFLPPLCLLLPDDFFCPCCFFSVSTRVRTPRSRDSLALFAIFLPVPRTPVDDRWPSPGIVAPTGIIPQCTDCVRPMLSAFLAGHPSTTLPEPFCMYISCLLSVFCLRSATCCCICPAFFGPGEDI